MINHHEVHIGLHQFIDDESALGHTGEMCKQGNKGHAEITLYCFHNYKLFLLLLFCCFIIYLSSLFGYDVPIVEIRVIVYLTRVGNHFL